ncbi:MAG: hypothetical protein IT460_09010 [Planctomycetes bacterium]|nr:hypothetical protein [Planctomycetota bacterium]
MLVRAVWSPSLDGELIAALVYGLAQWSNDDASTTACRLRPEVWRLGALARGRPDRSIAGILDDLSADLLDRPDLDASASMALIEVSAARVGLESRALQELTGPRGDYERTSRMLAVLQVRPLESSFLPLLSELCRDGHHRLRERAWRVLLIWDARNADRIVESPQDEAAPLLDECTRLSAVFGRGETGCWSAPPDAVARASRRFCSDVPHIDLDSPASGTREAVEGTERALHAIAEAYETRRADVGAPVAECLLTLFTTGMLLTNTGAEAELLRDFPASEDWFPELFASPSLDRCPTPVLALVARVARRQTTDDDAWQRQRARLACIVDRREATPEDRQAVLAPDREPAEFTSRRGRDGVSRPGVAQGPSALRFASPRVVRSSTSCQNTPSSRPTRARAESASPDGGLTCDRRPTGLVFREFGGLAVLLWTWP